MCAIQAPAGAAAPANRYVVSAGTVYDTKTKLTWQQTPTTTMYQWNDAIAYCASASVSAALGGTGWRLPTIKELQTLIDFTQATNPMIDHTAFPGTASGGWWSSTPATASSSEAWAVFFYGGDTGTIERVYGSAVRCVR
jgi:hypothetical protein